MKEATITHLHSMVFDYILDYLSSRQWKYFRQHILRWQEKREDTSLQLIDILPLASAITGGHDYTEALPVASAWVLHIMAARTFDDIHDLPIPSKNVRQESATAIVWIGLANAILASIPDQDASIEIMTRFNYGMAMAARAEFNKPQYLPPIQDALQIMGEKTGVPFASATWAGARVKEKRQDLYEFGYNAGIFIQLIDDIRDIEEDIQQGIYPFLIAYTQDKTRQQLIRLVEERKGKEVKDLLHKSGAARTALALANLYRARALKAVKDIPDEQKIYLLELIVKERAP